jgi:hypothetical protein
VARRNASANGVNITFMASDWFEALGTAFDLIVSNPPYIASGDRHLAEGDLRFEPAGALTDHADGLSALRTIVAGAARHIGGRRLAADGTRLRPGRRVRACWPLPATPRCKAGATWPASSASAAPARLTRFLR